MNSEQAAAQSHLAKQRGWPLVVEGEWLDDYLANTAPDPAKAERAKQDRELVESFVPLSELRKRRLQK